jgi:hypothetical protein
LLLREQPPARSVAAKTSPAGIKMKGFVFIAKI